MEFYVGCGLRCKLDGEGIKKQGRPPVKLAIVLDISGSMSQAFRYGEDKNKLQVAIDCVMTLIDNLQPTDSFGLVAFDDVPTRSPPSFLAMEPHIFIYVVACRGRM
jgi:hypothetical protein